jgi:hypothetical protein
MGEGEGGEEKCLVSIETIHHEEADSFGLLMQLVHARRDR